MSFRSRSFPRPGLFAALAVTAAVAFPPTASAFTPPDLELTLFAEQPMVRNAVAVTIDDHNRVYVTSVVRRQANDLDIRRFREWIENDLSFTSVAAKEAFFKRQLTTENSPVYAGRFEDANGDGFSDWRDLDLLADMVTRLEDTDGDGVADVALKFNAAENSTITGIAAGLAAWDDTLYATVEPDLVLLTDTTGDGMPNHREVLAHGFSIHIGYGGHNFSGPVIGPDGRLYAAVADRGMNVTTPDGKSFYNPHSGAVVRCEFDGSNFEVYATGLRNVHEPAFDSLGNLLGVDNDGDFTTEKERFVYITEGSDTGWRTNWQYRGKGYLPWMAEGLSIPEHPGQPAYITPAIQNYLDGPAGFAYNPGTALNPAYRDFFFLARFPGRDLYAFRAQLDGAAVKMVDSHLVNQGVLAVGVDFGADGALYLADWASSGYAMNENGAVWKLDDPTDARSPLRRETAALLAQDWQSPSRAALRQQLGHLDQRVRMKAQFELVRRGATDVLRATAQDLSAPRLARLHAIWGLGQFIRHHQPVSADSLLALLTDADAEVRSQTAKIISEARSPAPELLAALEPLLQDRSDRPRFFAAIALGRLRTSTASSALVAYLERDGADAFHRHAAVMGLVGTTPPNSLAALSSHPSNHVRLGAIVALRRLHAPAVAAFLQDPDPLVVAEAASAIHDDDSIPEAFPALVALLQNPAGAHERTLRRAISAAVRLRTPAHAARVAQFAQNETQPLPLRLLALQQLQTWPQPPNLDSVEGRFRPLDPVTPAAIAPSVATALLQLSQSAEYAIAAAAWAATDVFDLAPASSELIVIVDRDTPIAAAALQSLDRLNATELPAVAQRALHSAHLGVRQQALRTLARINPAAFVTAADTFLNDASAIAESRVAIELAAVSTQAVTTPILRTTTQRLADGTIAPELALDVLLAAEASSDPITRAALSRFQATKNASDPLSPYLETLHGGDPTRGEAVFETSVVAQCTLCHRIGREGSDVGPRLNKIGEKTPHYLLESLVNPGAVVALGFGITTVTLQDGSVVAGTLLAETDTSTTIKLADGTEQKISRASIANRTPEMSAMPPMGTLITKSELRDLLAYLQTLK